MKNITTESDHDRHCERQQLKERAQPGGPSRQQWLDRDLRTTAIHEAAHAVANWEFRFSSRIYVEEVDGNPDEHRIVIGRCEVEGQLTGNARAIACLAGLIGELIYEGGGNRVWPDDALESIQHDGMSAFDLNGIRDFYRDSEAQDGFWEIADETQRLLRDRWDSVQRLADALIDSFHADETGVGVVTDGECEQLLTQPAAEEPAKG